MVIASGMLTKVDRQHLQLLPLGPVDALSEGDVTMVSVTTVVAGKCIFVTTPHGRGQLDITDISDHYTENPLQTLTKDGTSIL